MRFSIFKSPVKELNADYEMTRLGGYRKFPDRSIKKPPVWHLLTWAFESGGEIRVGDKKWQLIEANYREVLEVFEVEFDRQLEREDK